MAASAGILIPETVAIPAGRPYALGRTPVTNGEYSSFLASGRASPPPWWSDPAFSSPRHPVVGVTWHEAAAYCDFLGEAGAGRFRLPTEAEWEFAMCGGLRAPRTAWGDALPDGEVPEGPIAGPWEVGLGRPNDYGLFDPGTIVHEWCLDWSEPEAPPSGARRRASRGGSWRHAVRWSAPSARTSLPPSYRYSDYGFRVLREAAADAC